MSVQQYTIPVIPQELRPEETVIAIANVLDQLNLVADDVMQKITSRIGEYRTQLETINKRAKIAQAKIDKLKGSNKATKVLSSAKFPGNDRFIPNTPTFVDIPPHLQKINSEKLEPVKSKFSPVDDKVLKEKLQFYNIQLKSVKRGIESLEEGLGDLPAGLTSASSLLLFNTAENPYKKYVITDPLGSTSKTRKVMLGGGDEENRNTLGQAPMSISQRDQMQQENTESYTYMPGLGNVPEIDVPLDLPDLPGIADDLAYSGDIGPTIAPSMPLLPSVPDLPCPVPELPRIENLPVIEPMPQSLPPISREQIPTLPISVPLPPPPPPPPPPLIEVPPPPFEEKKEEVVPKMTTSTSLPSEMTQIRGDARSNLLESIRKVGGKAGLKSVKDRKIEAKKKKQEEKDTSGNTSGDLMSDLFNTLALRRKGISGKAKTEMSMSSALDRMSSMIPAPSKQAESSVTEDEDSDWNEV